MAEPKTMKKILKWIVGIVLYIFLVILFVDGRHWLESRFREDDGVKIELLRSARPVLPLELGTHPKPTQIADALVYVGGYPHCRAAYPWRFWRLFRL